MFFEGSEKKVEVIVRAGSVDLRTLGREFWSTVVQKANATILSVIQNDACDAYLLSESSLFVWRDRILMITCGVTALVDAVLHVLEHFDTDDLLFFCYQRKNEYIPSLQKSSFEEDIRKLQKHLPGKAYRLGSLDSHHYYLYHLEKEYQAQPEDTTSELLMYHIMGPTADFLRTPNQTADETRRRLQIETFLPGFQIDDYQFDPFGYSLNAIRGDRYATIHITPQSENSYVSFESNLDMEQEGSALFAHFVELLQPGSWDLMTFNCNPSLARVHATKRISFCELGLDCGFEIRYQHYQTRENTDIKAYKL